MKTEQVMDSLVGAYRDSDKDGGINEEHQAAIQYGALMTDDTITSLMFTRDASRLLKNDNLEHKAVRIPKLNLRP
jgi:hypothetical protein